MLPTIKNKKMNDWVDIIGHEGLYQINRLGKLRSVDRYVKGRNGKRLIKGKEKNAFKTTNGYMHTTLYKNNKGKKHSIHRLLAVHFIPNPDSKPCVNHINGIKHDNRLENLEWVTISENHRHALELGLITQAKPVYQCDENWNIINAFPSAGNAMSETGINNIDLVLINKQKTAGGYYWKYQ
ncbi:MAG: hypothetical protein Tsb0033_27770 [Winogradskyella sp.]